MTVSHEMKNLYGRLKKTGFDAGFLRRFVLPEWWDDAMASVPANLAMAEMAIARHLGLGITELRNTSSSLSLRTLGNVRLKRNKNIRPADVAPAMRVAFHAAELIVDALTDVPQFGGVIPAKNVRKAILRKSGSVTLENLVEFCWSHGIALLHLATIPEYSKKLDGMAMYCGSQPVIVLASAKDSPAWLAYHLAHELGHVLHGHVKAGQPPWVDSDIGAVVNDKHETEADQFACTVLTGKSQFGFLPSYGMTAPKLAHAVRDYGRKHKIDPGVAALFYGRSADRWGVAQLALKYLGRTHGAHQIIASKLWTHMHSNDMPESSERFLSVVSAAA